jgi:hypothetical protein
VEYAKRCQKCEHLKNSDCYGTRRGQRTGNCFLVFRQVRKEWIECLPAEGRVNK